MKFYKTHRSSGYGHECHIELTEVPGRYKNVVPIPRVCWHGRTELTEVPGTGMDVQHNLQAFLVRVWVLYSTHRSFG